ncbi:hypothetical protein STEG23_017156 [Scotinomys teguina]
MRRWLRSRGACADTVHRFSAASAPITRRPEIRGGSSNDRPLIRSDHFHFLLSASVLDVRQCWFVSGGICFSEERSQLPVFSSAFDWLVL